MDVHEDRDAVILMMEKSLEKHTYIAKRNLLQDMDDQDERNEKKRSRRSGEK